MIDVGFKPENIQPTLNRVLIKLDEPAKESRGGIQLPEAMRDRQKVEYRVGRVLAVGPGKPRRLNGAIVVTTRIDIPEEGGTREVVLTEPLLVAVGQRVFADPPYAASVPGYPDYLLLDDDAVMAVLSEE